MTEYRKWNQEISWKNTVDSDIAEHNALFDAWQDAQQEIERLKQNTQRRCSVRFDCTPEMVSAKDLEWIKSHRGRPIFMVEQMQNLMDYIAEHAVAEVPEGVPSISDVMDDYWIGYESIPDGKHLAGVQAAYDRLAPYLHAPASVDPTICDTPLEIESSLGWNSLKFDAVNSSHGFVISLKKDSANHTPADAHRAGLWLLSYAASEGIDVRLPAYPPQAYVPRSELDAMREERDKAYDEGLAAGRAEASPPAETPGDIEIATLDTRGDGSVDIHPTSEMDVQFYLHGRRLVPESETFETLDQLAEMHYLVWAKERGTAQPDADWESLSEADKQLERDQVTAILQSTRPVIDVDDLAFATNGDMSLNEACVWLNSCIYHTVHVPPDTIKKPQPVRRIFCEYEASNLKDLREHSAHCEKHPLWQPPIATAETLEQLAEILRDTTYCYQDKEGSICVGNREAAVTAILQAARPVIDLKPGSVWRCGKSELHYEDLDALHARIRYTVAVPPKTYYEREDGSTSDSFQEKAECETCESFKRLGKDHNTGEFYYTIPAKLAEAERRINAARKALEGSE